MKYQYEIFCKIEDNGLQIIEIKELSISESAKTVSKKISKEINDAIYSGNNNKIINIIIKLIKNINKLNYENKTSKELLCLVGYAFMYKKLSTNFQVSDFNLIFNVDTKFNI